MKCWKCKEELVEVEVTLSYSFNESWIEDEFRGAKCEKCGASIDENPLDGWPDVGE